MDIRDVDKQIDEVASDRRRAAAKKEEEKVKLAVMAREVFDLKIDYLDGARPTISATSSGCRTR